MAADPRRLYRTLLHLLPRAFREEAERDLTAVFDSAYARVADRSLAARSRFWAAIACDLLVTAIAERIGRRRSRPVNVRAWFSGALHDVRYALRSLLQRPDWTLVNAGTLAVGLAATVVATVLVKDVLLAPLPFPHSDRLVRLREVSDNGRRWWPSFPNARDWREQARVFSGVGIADIPRVRVVLIDGMAARVAVSRAAGGLFETLGVRMVAGRTFTAAENTPGGAPAAIVTEAFWRGPLHGNPLDRLHVSIGTTQYSVVGVLPASFRFLGDGGVWTSPADIWTPMERDTDLGSRASHGYHVVARLADGVTLDRARVDMNALSARLKSAHHEPTQADAVEIRTLQDFVVARAREPLHWLLYASLAVLLVACLNLAASLLAQGLDRRRELTIRLALGASSAQLVRHLLIQAAALALPAIAAGLAVAAAAIDVTRAEAVSTLPRLDELALDARTCAVAAATAIATAILAGIAPAMLLASRRFAGRLRTHDAGATAGHRRFWPVLISAQVALSMLLLVGSGLLIRSFVAALTIDLGYSPDHVLEADVSLPDIAYAEPARRVTFYDRALERLRSTAGVTAVGLTSVMPQETSAMTAPTSREGQSDRSVDGGYRLVDEGYFAALRIPEDYVNVNAFRAGGAIVDRTLQRALWNGGNPEGESVRNFFADRALPVAGVVGAVREWDQDAGTTGTVYVDFHTRPESTGTMHLMVRYGGAERDAVNAVRQALAAVDPMVPISIAPLQERVTGGLADRRFLTLVAVTFGLVALALASVGVYALVAFSVARRLRESAIRLALGASPSAVRAGTLRIGVVPALVGILLALAGSLWLGPAIRAQLFHVNPVDPLVLTAAAAAALGAALLAATVPALRATRVDPAAILRPE